MTTGPKPRRGNDRVAAVHVDVGVVVVTYNSEDQIDGLLDSLGDALDGLRAHVVVVDNGSTDNTIDRVRRRGSDVEVLAQSNRGYAAGINAGVRTNPRCPAWLVLNPDVRLGERSARLMVESLDSPGVGIVVPKVLDEAGQCTYSLRRVPSLGRASGLSFTHWRVFDEYVRDERSYDHGHPVDWALGAVMLVSRECHEALGGWDESYFLYSEETDLCLRARDAGFATWYEPEAVAVHAGGGSGRDDVTHTMQILNRVRLYARRHGTMRGWLYYALTVVSEMSWVVRGQPQSRASLRGLLRPGRRPVQLGLSDSLLPR